MSTCGSYVKVVSGAVELVDIRDRMAANDTEVAQMRGQHEAMVARVAAAEALAKQHATGVKALQHQLSAEHEKLATQVRISVLLSSLHTP